MKKIKLLIFTFVCLLVFSAGVMAKTCEYNNAGGMSGFSKAYLIINDNNNSAYATVMNYNGKAVEPTTIKLENWDNIKSTYESTGKCPYFASVTYDKSDFDFLNLFSSAKVYVSYEPGTHYSDGQGLTSVTYSEDSAEGQKNADNAKKDLSQKASICNGYIIGYNSKKISDCKDDNNITTKYSKCQDSVKQDKDLVNSFISQAKGYVTAGKVSESDGDYQNVIKLCENAKKEIGEFEEALTKIANEDYNKDMGTDIESSVSDDDVKDNKYYNEARGNDPYNPDPLSTDFLGICDPSTSPKTVAAFKLGGIFIVIAKILAPIIMIIMGMLDISKAVVDSKDGAIKKSLINFLKRAVAGILIFFTPALILAIYSFVDGWDKTRNTFSNCMNCLLNPSNCKGSLKVSTKG